jgi:hypothetical protein
MGAAALVGLGLAQARPDRKVLVVTGDGEQLMGLGGLATIAIAAPANLVVVVLDNGHHGENGMQMSHSGLVSISRRSHAPRASRLSFTSGSPLATGVIMGGPPSCDARRPWPADTEKRPCPCG